MKRKILLVKKKKNLCVSPVTTGLGRHTAQPLGHAQDARTPSYPKAQFKLASNSLIVEVTDTERFKNNTPKPWDIQYFTMLTNHFQWIFSEVCIFHF
jgi:hypothetical protein